MPPITPAQNNTINEKNAIATSVLENPTKTPNLPVTQPVNIPDVSSFIATPQQDKQTQDNIDNLTAQSGSVFNELFGTMQKKETRGAQQTQMEQQAGIPQLTEDLADIQNQITNSNLQFRRAQEDLYKNPSLRGVPMSVIRSKESEIARVAASNLADLEVVRAARSNSLNAIQSIIDRKVQRQFADDEARINNLKFVYENVKGDLTKAQDRQYQEKITKESRAFELAKDKYQQVENVKAELVKNAHMNGAGNGVLQAVMAAKDLAGAYAAAGNFGLSIDDKIKRASYAKAMKDLAGSSANQLQDSEITGVPSQDLAKIIDVTGAKSTKGITDALGVIKGVETFAKRNPEGTFIGMAPIRFLPAVFRGAEAKTERQFNLGDINAINLKVQQWASGASLTTEQTKQVKRLVPDKNDTDAQIKRKVNQLTQYMIGQVQSELSSQGIQTGTPTFDFFNQTTTLNVDENGNVVIPGETSDEDFWK